MGKVVKGWKKVGESGNSEEKWGIAAKSGGKLEKVGKCGKKWREKWE